MKALVTGASSGIGRDMAYLLDKLGYDLILTARRKDRLEEVKAKVKHSCKIIVCDLSVEQNCFDLYNRVKNEDIDILINCAGYGIFGEFLGTDLDKELKMLNTNIYALHILTKLFLSDFMKKNKGYILNVASTAAFAPGPLLSSYYASKSYVLRLTEAIWEELKSAGSKVVVSALCPGPVDTEFNDVANVRFTVGSLTSEYVASYAIKGLFKGKRIIVPGFKMKMARFGSKLLPNKILAKITYNFQKKKI